MTDVLEYPVKEKQIKSYLILKSGYKNTWKRNETFYVLQLKIL